MHYVPVFDLNTHKSAKVTGFLDEQYYDPALNYVSLKSEIVSFINLALTAPPNTATFMLHISSVGLHTSQIRCVKMPLLTV